MAPTLVEVRALTPGVPDELTRSVQSPPPTLYVQAGAFADRQNAQRTACAAAGGRLVQRRRRFAAERTHAPLPRAARAGAQRGGIRRARARLAALGFPDARLAID